MPLSIIIYMALNTGSGIYGYLPILYDEIKPRVRTRVFLRALNGMYK